MDSRLLCFSCMQPKQFQPRLVICSFLMICGLDACLKLQLASAWLCPQDVISLHSSSSAWLCIVGLQPCARFAVSRCQRSGGDLLRSAAWWHELWLHCKRVVRQRGWPISVWRSSCRCSRYGHPYIATESFFCALDLILAFAEHPDTCLAALAMDIELEPAAPNFFLQCVVVLSSGRIAFVGTLESPVEHYDDRFIDIFHNVVVADTVEEAALAAVAFVAQHASDFDQGDSASMPWENDHGSIRVNFCTQGCRGRSIATIPDPFIIEDATVFMALASLH
jgi:hypothetical protein